MLSSLTFFKLWTRSKARAAKAVSAEEEVCECPDEPKRPSPVKKFFQSARQLLRISPDAKSTPLQKSYSFSHLSRVAEDNDASPTQDPTVSSANVLPRIRSRVPLTTLETSVENIAFAATNLQTAVKRPPKPHPPQPPFLESFTTAPEELPPPPEEWLEIHEPLEEDIDHEHVTINPFYDDVVIQQNEENLPDFSGSTYILSRQHPQFSAETETSRDQQQLESDGSNSPLDSMRMMEESLERQLENLRLEHEDHERRMAVLHTACQESLGFRGVFSFPTFKGEENEDIHSFINNYTRAAEMCGWTKEKQVKALPLYLKGAASIWFTSLPDSGNLNYDQLVGALEKQFASTASNWRLRQILNERKQKEGELLSSYATDIRKQCSRLNLPPSEWLHHFVKGLRRDIKEYVALREPATFEAAENFAKLKEVMSADCSSAPVDTKKLSQEIIQQLKESGLASASLGQMPKSTVAAISKPSESAINAGAQFGNMPFSSSIPSNLDPTINSLNFPSLPQQNLQYAAPHSGQQYDSMPSTATPDIRQIVREEIQQQFRSQGQSQNANRVGQNRSYSGSFARGRRTTSGVIICGYCGKRGHAIYNCRSYFAQNTQRQDQSQRNFNRNRNQNQSASNQRQQNPANLPNQEFPVRSTQHKPQEN